MVPGDGMRAGLCRLLGAPPGGPGMSVHPKLYACAMEAEGIHSFCSQ